MKFRTNRNNNVPNADQDIRNTGTKKTIMGTKQLAMCPAQGIALRTRRLDATYVYSDIPPLAFSDVVTKV